MTAHSLANLDLSAATHGYLAGLCDASNIVWTEAGMGYSISTQTTRTEPTKSDVPALVSRHDSAFSPTDIQVDAMARFLQGATGDLEHRYTVSRHTDIARSLLKRLHDDLDYQELIITISEHDTGADATIDMRVPLATVRLEIGWAVD